MNIAQIICVFPPYKSGMGNSVLKISEALAKRGHAVTVFTPDFGLSEKEIISNFKVIRLKPLLKRGNGAFLPQLLPKLKNFDAVHLHYPFFGGAEVVWLAKLLYGKKMKLVLHNHMDISGLSPLMKLLSLPSALVKKSLFKKAGAIVCASFDYAAESGIKKYFTEFRNKFFEVPFGVDADKFYPENKKSNVNRPQILFVGGLDKAHYFKGIDVLLNALGEIKNIDWSLRIIGKGELKAKYEEQAKKLNITDRVSIVEKITDNELQEAYRRSDLFVLPSINRGEAFGLVLLEAMSSGIPVIATNLSGVRKVFNNGSQGLLAEPNDVASLREALLKLIKDEQLRKKMGEAGRKLVLEKYSWERVGEEMEKIYGMLNSR